jgi:arginine/lysine/ornithine decarboxylase
MKRPLKEGLTQVIEENRMRFHMPGHKGRQDFLLPLQWDFTEIPETDDLHNPTGILRESQICAARIFGAEDTYYLVNGATGGLEAALLAALTPGDRVVVPRNAHQSIHYGIEFAGAEPIYLMPVQEKNGLVAGVDPAAFRNVIEAKKPVAAVFTYPTYEGVCWDLPSLIAICREHGVISIVDEAHGAHFSFFSTLPASAVEMKADLVVQSAHKMLPAPTQTALLHRGSDVVPREWIREALRRTQTSSPSYLLLLGMEEAIAWMSQQNEPEELIMLEACREAIRSLPGIELVEGKKQDPYKFVISAIGRGFSGTELYEALRAGGVEPEWQQGNLVLLMGAPYQDRLAWTALIEVLASLPEKKRNQTKRPLSIEGQGIPERVMTTLEARRAKRTWITMEESVGKILAENLTPYPPGIPAILAGERMTEEIMHYLKRIKDENGKIYGENGKIPIVCE